MDKGTFGRSDRLLKQKRHDVYQEQGKLPDPTGCSDCGAVFTNGRWTWKEVPPMANTVICPACRRMKEQVPSGHIEIKGAFFNDHRQEILNLVNNVEKQEKGEHPQERIMKINDRGDNILVTTTGIHIARRIGESLARSYKGEHSFQYLKNEKQILVTWERS
ncbi:MAG: BCAM0308 family protein [Candidatus Neomarinimicrobiota bacterium]